MAMIEIMNFDQSFNIELCPWSVACNVRHNICWRCSLWICILSSAALYEQIFGWMTSVLHWMVKDPFTSLVLFKVTLTLNLFQLDQMCVLVYSHRMEENVESMSGHQKQQQQYWRKFFTKMDVNQQLNNFRLVCAQILVDYKRWSEWANGMEKSNGNNSFFNAHTCTSPVSLSVLCHFIVNAHVNGKKSVAVSDSHTHVIFFTPLTRYGASNTLTH